jgi:hypothetical protein
VLKQVIGTIWKIFYLILKPVSDEQGQAESIFSASINDLCQPGCAMGSNGPWIVRVCLLH